MQLGCADLGSTDCPFIAKGKTAAEVKKKLMAHAQKDHPDELKAMSKEQLDEAMRLMSEILAKQE